MLSPKQLDSYVESEARINVLEGAVRSGKTVSSLLKWAKYAATAPRGGELAVIGKTAQTVARNVFAPLTDPAVVGHAVAKSISYTSGAAEARMFGRRVHVIGANDAKAEPKIRGLTGAGAYVDEATVIPEDFWDQLVARQSTPGAKLFATTNPSSPAHWLKRKWLDANNPSVRSWHFTLDDNPFLDPEYVAHLKRSYSGLWYRRFILGEWCAAEGAIYDSFDHDVHVVDRIPVVVQWIVGLDYGTTNPFHAVLIGCGDDGRLYVTAEYRYDSRTAQRQLTDAEYSERLRIWLDSVRLPNSSMRGIRPSYVVVDPSALSFRTQLFRDGLTNHPADNAVDDGIRTVASLLAAGHLLIHDSCTHLIREMSGYSWDPKAQLLGEDRPLKVDDHGVDALRYGIFTTRSVWLHRLPFPVPGAYPAVTAP